MSPLVDLSVNAFENATRFHGVGRCDVWSQRRRKHLEDDVFLTGGAGAMCLMFVMKPENGGRWASDRSGVT